MPNEEGDGVFHMRLKTKNVTIIAARWEEYQTYITGPNMLFGKSLHHCTLPRSLFLRVALSCGGRLSLGAHTSLEKH